MSHSSRRLLGFGLPLLLLLGLGLLAIVMPGCQFGSGKARDAAASDSLDSLAASRAPADSAAAPKRQGGFHFGFGRSKDKDKKEAPPVPVELAPVVRRDLADHFATTATLEAEKEAQIVAKTSGQVMRLLVEEGDPVTAGQPLLIIDDAEARVRVAEAEVNAATARREYERMQAMWEKGHVAEREMADVRTQHEGAQAALELAKLALAHTKVTAPFAGLVTERHIDPGENAAPGTPLFTVADLHPLLARVYMPERQVARVAVGQEATVIPDAAPAEPLRGRVTMIAPRVDPRTGTVKVTVELDDSSPAARPGSFVRVEIVTDLRRDVLAMPKRALVSEAGESFVFRAQADSVVRVPVTTGYEDEEMIEVATGLAFGERVVRVGQGALKPGSKIAAIAAPDSGLAGRKEGEGAAAALRD